MEHIMNAFVNFRIEHGSFILVEGPAWGSAEFYGSWLLAASQAEEFWKAIQKELDFEEEFEPICFTYLPDFGRAAALMIMELKEYETTLLINLDKFEGWDFAMMFGMGFFAEVGQRYQMIVPSALTEDRVKKAILALVSTDDEECQLHPEYLVNPISFTQARADQDRRYAIENQMKGPILGNA
jgi:hypothetical protein